MKLNKILSSALVLVMIFTALVAVIPTKASAAYDADASGVTYTSDEILEIINTSIKANFSTAEEMLSEELSKGYLDYVTTADKAFTIYVNRYTGALYYVNNYTGQILTSNPYDLGYINSEDVRKLLSSQVIVDFTIVASGKTQSYDSTSWAASYGQISTDYIKNGIRVNYTLGDTAARFLLPGRISAERFEEAFIKPAFASLADALTELLGEHYEDEDFYLLDDEDAYETNSVPAPDGQIHEYTTIKSSAISSYFTRISDLYEDARIRKYITPKEYNEIDAMRSEISGVLSYYTLKNPAREYSVRLAEMGREQSSVFKTMIADYYTKKDGGKNLEIYETYAPLYEFDLSAGTTTKRKQSLAFQEHSDGYSFTDMYEDEAFCGYVDKSDPKPVFRCSLEYSFNEDGSLSVRLPASSITFDESLYILEGISPLKFFGAGDMKNDGYIFYPDGSGTVVEFEDFYHTGTPLYLTSEIYGSDYCYTTITGQHREQITMPVYGISSTVNANAKTASLTGKETVKNGYFAIVETGAPLTKIGILSGGVSHKYACVYNSYTPNASDVFDITGTVGVGEATEYKMVSESKYSGSYVTRYVMLADEAVGENVYGKDKFYPATYSGMAAYYRSYLEADGTLKALEAVSENLPLYIEALGSMEINDKFLTFPIRTKIPLTTFENVIQMYQELADTDKTKKSYEALAEQYEALAENEADEAKAAEYTKTAEGYRKIAEMIVDITNVNFRLTGFGNGGMYYTYPTKVRWDNACGDSYGFNQLLVEAEKVSKTEGANFGVYPDYDFMYLKYDEWFDGISVNGNVSRMIDNRYASKQMYNQVNREWESAFDLVINPAALSTLYASFISQYDDYAINSVSVSTLGSDLNSNFDGDEPTNRVEAMGYVTDVLGRMKYNAKLDIMTDVGNIYSVKYVNHILNASIDSSHFIYSSYAVPFFGMVLHGYVNYTGTPINYVGTPEYDILRSIENGASLYYILCYQNSAHMKDDEELNQYYGVDYNTWYEDIVTTYAKLNDAIGGKLQNYKIVDHRVIIGERIIDEREVKINFTKLKNEILAMLAEQIDAAINAGYEELDKSESEYGTPLTLKIDYTALMAQFSEILNKTVAELEADGFSAQVKALVDGYLAEFGTDADEALVNFGELEYNSQYSFITDSVATDEDYVYTDYTSDVGNIILVTYSNGTDTVKFILNYNIYSVTVNLGGGVVRELGKYEFAKIEG